MTRSHNLCVFRCWVATLLASGVLLSVCSTGAAQSNIIHIVADDLGWTDLSTGLTNLGNGSSFYQTPNIDRLANEGIAFTSAYALQSCVPTRVSVLSGQYATRTDVYTVGSFADNPNNPLVSASSERNVPDAATTIGETLQTAGYTTAHFGKFHVTASAADITGEHGFDFNFGGGTAGAPNDYFAAANGTFDNTVGPELDAYAAPYTQAYVDTNLKPFANGADVDSLVGTSKHLTDATADATVDFIQNQAGSDPFYLNVAFNAVHNPIQPRPDLQTKYDGILATNGGASPDPNHDDAAYAALLEGLDQAVGRILAAVEDPNGDGDTSDSIANDTVVFFYGDNGGTAANTSSAPLQGAKGSQQEGGLRVPLIAWSPGQVAGGTISDEPVHAVDFYTTFADIAGASLPDPTTHALDGVSLAPLLSGESDQLDRDGVFFHFPGYANSTGPVSTIVLDAGATRHKLQYYYENRQYELFDLNNDLGEANDLADGDLTPLEYKLAARGAVALRHWLDDTGAEYPTLRSDGSSAPPPVYLPQLTVEFGAELDNQTTATLNRLGVELTLNAIGAGAVFAADGNSLGVQSTLDTGNPNQNARINGELATAEELHFSFDRDVLLTSLSLAALNAGNTEQAVLRFVSGNNPFQGVDGYETAEGFTLGDDFLSFDASSATGMQHLLEFGVLGRDDLFLTAGTVLSLTADPAAGGGLLLDALTFAQPLSAVGEILIDYNLDGVVDSEDFQVFTAGFASQSDLLADGNADGTVDASDYVLLRDRIGGAAASVASGTGLSTTSFSAAQAVAVPEPTTLWLLATTAGACWRRRLVPAGNGGTSNC